MTPSEFTHQVIDDSSRVVSGAQITFRQGSRLGPVFLDAAMRTPARNPYITKADGMCHVFLNAGDTYEITIETPKGRRWQFTHVAKGKEIVREPSVTVSEGTQHGAAPEASPQPEPPTIVEVEKIVHVENPETQARLEEALRKLSEAEAKLSERKTGADVPPPDIADLIRLNETYEQTNARLVYEYRQAMQKAELARTRDGIFEGQSTTFWLRKAERYDSAVKWNRGRSAETI